jgi:Flp pilus assembly protein TadG
MFGIVEFGRAIWAYSVVAHSAREGVRFAIVRGSESGRAATATDVQNYVRGRAVGLSPVTVNTTWNPNNDPACTATPNQPGCVVQVTVQYTFKPALPLIFGTNIVLSSTSKMVISF